MIPGMTICSAVQLRQSQSEEKWSGFTYFNASGDHFAKHQILLSLIASRPGIGDPCIEGGPGNTAAADSVGAHRQRTGPLISPHADHLVTERQRRRETRTARRCVMRSRRGRGAALSQ